MTSTSRPEPKAHQRDDVEWIRRVKRGLLGNEPGTGKSRSAIEAFDGGNNLIIAPSLVLSSGTWDDEIARWSDHPEGWTLVPFSQLNERETFTTEAGRTATRLVDLNRGRPRTKPKYVTRADYLRQFDAVVIDEAHYTKGRHTNWAVAANEIASHADYLLEMTGTPMPNWAHELFMPLQAIFPDEAKRGQRLGAYWRWVQEWFQVSPSQYDRQAKEIGDLAACRISCLQRPAWDPCDHYREFVDENLGEHFRRVLRDQCLDLPPLTTQVVQTPMDAAQKRMYKQMAKDYVTSINGNEVVAWSSGSRNVALDRITTSPWCLDPEGPAKGGKFETLRYDLESRSRPTLVLAHYRTTVEGCVSVAEQVGAKATFIHGGISQKEAGKRARAFKEGKIDVLVGSLETLAEGLTFTQADMAIFVESSYKPSRNQQARYRIHRMGQERPCIIRDYRTPGSVDTRKHLLLDKKNDRQMRVLSARDFAELL